MLTRVTGTFVGIWNENVKYESSLFEFVSVLCSTVGSRLKVSLNSSVGICLIVTLTDHNKIPSMGV